MTKTAMMQKERAHIYLLTQHHFSFTSETKMIYDQEHGLLYVYEHLKDKAIYEVVSLQQMEGTWKLAGYHSNKILLAEIQALEKEQKKRMAEYNQIFIHKKRTLLCPLFVT
ncbi:hypothetical protein GCM10020331_044310 [Ectobacillus funiculus]